MADVTASSYAQLTRGLRDSPLQPSPAEAQGLLCGLLCARVPHAAARWVSEVFGGDEGDRPGDKSDPEHDPASEDLLEDLPPALRTLVRRTCAQFEGDDMALSLVLPEEDASLRERAEGIYDWARGLLLGLGLAGLRAENLSDQGREVLDNLLDITRLDLDGLDPKGGPAPEVDEEEESALMELHEFLWVAARLLHEDVGRTRGE